MPIQKVKFMEKWTPLLMVHDGFDMARFFLGTARGIFIDPPFSILECDRGAVGVSTFP